MNLYRSHLCSELSLKDLNQKVVLSGWVDTIRDHGNLLFIDLRDNFGITQCVIDGTHKLFNDISKITNESVIKISGHVVKRSLETVNKNLNTGEIEIKIEQYELLSKSEIAFIRSISSISLYDESNIFLFSALDIIFILSLILFRTCSNFVFSIVTPLFDKIFCRSSKFRFSTFVFKLYEPSTADLKNLMLFLLIFSFKGM